jgi:hypothetical protein
MTKTTETRLEKLSHLFVILIALAQLPHSVWVFSTLFGSVQPEFSLYELPEQSAYFNLLDLGTWLVWAGKALLIPIALDVGLIVIAKAIRTEQNPPQSLYKAFGFLAFSVYIIQFYFLIHHAPDLQLSAGATPIQMLENGLDIVWLFLFPAFMPVPTMFYTFAVGQHANRESAPRSKRVRVEKKAPAALKSGKINKTELVRQWFEDNPDSELGSAQIARHIAEANDIPIGISTVSRVKSELENA